MQLYFAKGTCSLAVRIIMAEIKITPQFIEVNLKTKKMLDGTDFTKINSKGTVPVIQTDDGKTMTENVVILQYLADHFHREDLLPKADNYDRYLVLEWLNYIATDLHKGFSPLFAKDLPHEFKENIFKKNLLNKIDYVETNLEAKTYLMGANFSLADAYLFVILMWAKNMEFDMTKWSNLSRYYQNLQQRDAIKMALRDESIELK